MVLRKCRSAPARFRREHLNRVSSCCISVAPNFRAAGAQQSIELCKRLRDLGIDLIDCSSGGLVPHAKIELGPGYQVPFARAIRRDAQIATCAVGLISNAVQAEEIVALGDADAVCLARALLRDPYWPRHAAKELGVAVKWPDQYLRCDAGPMGR